MATANEIEGYNPQPLAFGSTQLPAAANDVVLDMMPGMAAWQHYADQKLAVAKDLYDDLKKKQLIKQAEVAKALDQGQYKIWDADRTEFNKLWGNYTKLVKEVAKRGTWGDVNDDDYLKTLDMAGELDQFAQYSTQQQKHFEVGDEAYLKDNSKYNPSSRESLDSYRNVGNPITRAGSDYEMKVRSGFDLSKYFPIVLNRLREDNPTLTPTGQDAYGYVTYAHDTELKVDGATQIAEGTWTSDPDAQDFGEDLYAKNPGQFASPKDAFVQNFVNATVPKDLQDELKGRVYAPEGVRNPPPVVQKQTNFTVNFTKANPNYKVFTMHRTDPSKKVDETFYVVKDENGKTITFPKAEISKPDGSTNTVANITEFRSQADADRARRTSGGVSSGKIKSVWLPTKTAEFPANLPIVAPQIGWDVETNAQLTPQDIGTDSWVVDLVAIEDWSRNKKTGALAFEDYIKDNEKGNYETVRLANVKKSTGASVRIPYDNNISVPLTNALTAAKIPLDLPSIDVSIPFTDQKSQQPAQQQQPKAQSSKNTLSLSALKAKYDFGEMTDEEITKFYTDKDYEVTK